MNATLRRHPYLTSLLVPGHTYRYVLHLNGGVLGNAAGPSTLTQGPLPSPARLELRLHLRLDCFSHTAPDSQPQTPAAHPSSDTGATASADALSAGTGASASCLNPSSVRPTAISSAPGGSEQSTAGSEEGAWSAEGLSSHSESYDGVESAVEGAADLAGESCVWRKCVGLGRNV